MINTLFDVSVTLPPMVGNVVSEKMCAIGSQIVEEVLASPPPPYHHRHHHHGNYKEVEADKGMRAEIVLPWLHHFMK